MAFGLDSSAGAITLDQLIALNDEIAALVRAGVPLEEGLAALGGDLPGQPGRLAQLLATRMSSGESLSKILSEDDGMLPPVWKAVVAAGLRSGKLAAALESLSATARRVAELRRAVGAGLVYPIVVLAFAYGVFLFLLLRLIPVVIEAQGMLIGHVDRVFLVLNGLGAAVWWWVIPLPVVVVGLVALLWRRSGRSSWFSSVSSEGWSRQIRGRGGIRGTIRLSRMATFSEVMALLVRERVPLEDALTLAAQSSGDRAIVQAANEVAERIRRGDKFENRDSLPSRLPPLMGWLLLSADRQPDLSAALYRNAAVYRSRAERKAVWTAIYLPIWLTLFAGGTAVFICGSIAFLPLLRLFYQLSLPLGS